MVKTSILNRFQKIYIFELKIKNWIEWSKQIFKIWEKIRTRTYWKFLLLPFKFESQSGPEKADKRNIFILWQEFRSQYWVKHIWIPLLWHMVPVILQKQLSRTDVKKFFKSTAFQSQISRIPFPVLHSSSRHAADAVRPVFLIYRANKLVTP